MKILIAEDDRVSRRILEDQLTRWGYEVVSARDGAEAWVLLQKVDAPALAVLDWMMPELNGIELCRQMRNDAELKGTYILMVTAKGETASMIQAFEAGADDYVVKPFHQEELRARIQAGARIIEMRNELTEKIRELQAAQLRVQQLQGLLPICSYCRKIRDEKSNWQSLELFISTHSDSKVSHGICPECYQNIVQPEIDQIIAQDAHNSKKRGQE